MFRSYLRQFGAVLLLAALAGVPGILVAAPSAGSSSWGYWSGDGFFYSGRVTKSDNGRRQFLFDDGVTAWLAPEEIVNAPLSPGEDVQGDWLGRGRYYDGRVVSCRGDHVRIRYDDGYVEDTTVAHVRRQITPHAMLTPGRRVLGHWSPDGYWYPGTIEKIDGDRRFVRFDDGDTAWLPAGQVLLLRIWTGDIVEGNYLGRGLYYPARVQEVRGERVAILYTDGILEWTTFSRLRVDRTAYDLN